MKIKFTLPAFTALLLASSCGFAQAPAEGVPKDYPLKKCVISGETLGEHGKPVKVTSAATDVYLCCKSCVKDFNKDAEKFVKMVKDGAPQK
jgi:hypothetical protein